MSIHVLKLRGSCHLQDAGRVGEGHSGMPRGGCADAISATLANLIVDRKGAAPLLECALGGPDLRFESTCDIAITGADVQPKIDGIRVPMWQRLRISAGATLTSVHARNGLRTYIAFNRSIRAPRWRASVSPVLLGTELFPLTSVLKKGDQLLLADDATPMNDRIARSYVHVPEHMRLLEKDGPIDLQVQAAPESSLLWEHEEAFHTFRKSIWEVSAQSNRMGIRLVGPSLSLGKTGGLMRSGPVLTGSVQLLPDGQLIITHVDSQTIGGYPRVGIVDNFGLAVLAQAIPKKTKYRFHF